MKPVLLSSIAPLLFIAQLSHAIPFGVTDAKMQTIAENRTFFGTIEAINQATVSAQTSGRVVEILADIDDYVDQGQVILKLNATNQKAAVDAAKSGFAEARVIFDEATAEQTRIAEIYRQGLISKSAADKTAAALDAAMARMNSAKAGLERAQENLEYTIVRAPYAGIVMQRHVDVGEIANPGQSLFTGLSLDKLRVVSWVPQSLATVVRSEQQIQVFTESGEPLPVSSLTVFPYADPQTHSVKIRVDVAAEGKTLYPGMFVKLLVASGKRESLVIPSDAIVQRREVSAVYVSGPGTKLSLRHIRLGQQQGGYTEVLSGLSEGEQVATDPMAAGIYLKEILSGGDQ